MDLPVRMKIESEIYKIKPPSEIRLPNEIIYQILSMVSLRVIHVVARWLNPDFTVEDILHIMHKRYDPILYLSKLVDDPKELLLHMQDNLVVLSGSRAAGYFNPSLCSKSSDWDFYVAEYETHSRLGTSNSNLSLFVNYLLTLGAKIISGPSDRDISYEDLISGITSVTNLQTKKGHTIQVISHFDLSNIDRVAEFDLSVAQCIISGYCALSMQHQLTMSDKSIWWKQSRAKELTKDIKALQPLVQNGDIYNERNRMENELKALNDYNDRLIKYINRGVEILLPEEKTIERYLGDDKCFIVDFRRYGVYEFQDPNAAEFYPNLRWTDSNELGTHPSTSTGRMHINRLPRRDIEIWKF